MASNLGSKIAEMGFRTPFYGAFLYTLEQTNSRQEASVAALKVLAEREPFNVLDQNNVNFIASAFAPFTNCKKLIGDVLWEAQKYNDATPLKDRAFLQEMVKRLSEKEAMSPDTPEENKRLIKEKQSKKKSGVWAVILVVGIILLIGVIIIVSR